ncbi:MAG: thioesterase family protein [Gemmatimonadetes bacterium]|nr:thioesterase family protein [Gemmatimonadota bacterium]
MHKLRLFRLILSALLDRSPRDPFAPRTFRVRVTPFDVEFTRAVSHAYLAWCGLGRWYLLFHNVDWRQLLRERWIPLTHSEVIQYKRAARWFSRVEVTTRAIWWDDKMLYFEHRLTEGDALAALCYSRGALYRGRQRLSASETMPGLPAQPPFPRPAIVDWWTSGTDAWAAAAGSAPDPAPASPT